MWHLMLSLFFFASVLLSVVSAVPSPTPDLKFTCPQTLSKSLCCSREVQSNGAVKDCQESRHFLLNPATEENNATFVEKCMTSQLTAGYENPVCCNTKVRTFKFEDGAPIYLGVNCMDAEDISVGLEKRQLHLDTENASKTIPQQLDIEKLTKISPLDHRRDITPTATLPLKGTKFAKLPVGESVKTPTPLWRKRSARRAVKSPKKASRTRNSVANTIINDLNSASSRAIVRRSPVKTRTSSAARQASKPAARKQTRQLGSLSSTVTKLLGLGGSKGTGVLSRSASRWGGAKRRQAAAMVAHFA